MRVHQWAAAPLVVLLAVDDFAFRRALETMREVP
jgi:hypothetical protein